MRFVIEASRMRSPAGILAAALITFAASCSSAPMGSGNASPITSLRATPQPSGPPMASSSSPSPNVALSSVPTPTAREPWIVFQWGVNDVNALFLVRLDGSDTHRLSGTEIGSGAPSHPDWSPDGKSIAYLWHTGRDPDNIEIRAVSVDDGTVNTVVPCAVASCMQVTGPAYSHDGNWIAFGEADHTPGGDQLSIVVLNLTDGTRRVVARNEVGVSPLKEFGRPRWSPDDKQLVFFIASWAQPDAETPESTSVAIVSAAGSDVDEPRIVAGLPEFASYPDWSPLEGRLVFDTYDEAWFHGAPSAIYSANSNGTGLQRLTPNDVAAVHPTYSADGSEILYTTFGEDGWPRLSRMAVNGSERTVLDTKGMHPRLQPLP